MLRPDAWRIWIQATGVPGVGPEAGLRFASASLAYQAAIDGLGVAIAQHVYVEEDLRGGRLVAPFPEPVGTEEGYYLVCAEDKTVLPKHQAFLAWIRTCARRNVKAAGPTGSVQGHRLPERPAAGALSTRASAGRRDRPRD